MSQAALNHFFQSSSFAVAGASKDRAKYGNKVLRWYQAHNLPVTPIHPKEKQIESLDVVTSANSLPFPSNTSLSIITPPHITLPLLQNALLELGVPYAWLQPGAEDDKVKAWVKEAGVQDRVVLGGPCILVSGEDWLKEAKKEKL